MALGQLSPVAGGRIVGDVHLILVSTEPVAALPDLVLVADAGEARQRGAGLLLSRHQGALGLTRPDGREKPLVVDFVSGTLGFRRAHDRARHELVVRACGGVPDEHDRVIDATAGVGRDSALLAAAGFSVTMIERDPVLAAMLADGLRRLAEQDPASATRLSLVTGDAVTLLQQSPQSADVVLLDPMFPERQKHAAVKKALQFIQQLAPPPTPGEEQALLAAARTCARRRVVVKRSPRAPDLAQAVPGHRLTGKAVRFDIYPCA